MVRRAAGARQRLAQECLQPTHRGWPRNRPHLKRLLGDLANVAPGAAAERSENSVFVRCQVDQDGIAIRARLRGGPKPEFLQQRPDPLAYCAILRIHVHVHPQHAGTGSPEVRERAQTRCPSSVGERSAELLDAEEHVAWHCPAATHIHGEPGLVPRTGCFHRDEPQPACGMHNGPFRTMLHRQR